MIDVATELFEKSVKDCQTAVYHFIKTNKWFTGKIYLLTTSDSYPTTTSVDSIRKIYSNVEVINTSADSEFINLIPNTVITRENIWKYCLSIDTFRLLYMSNYSIVSTNLSDIITEKSSFISTDYDFIYFNGDRNLISAASTNNEIATFITRQTHSINLADILIYSSDIPDRIYATSLNLLKNSSVVVFNTLTSNFSSSTRINSVRLHKVRETLAYLTSPSAKIIHRAVYTPLPKSGAANNKIANALPSNRRHLIDKIPDNSLTFDLDNPAYLKNKDKKIKLAIVTGIWQRPEIFKYFAAGVKALELVEGLEITTIISGSEGETSRKLVEDCGFTYIEIPNRPLAVKMNEPLKIARELKVDYVLCMGSDDILHPNVLVEYLKYMRSEIDYIGVTDFYFYDTTTSKSAYWGGYREPYRSGHTCGAGRVLSAKLLDQWDWTVWSSKQDNMLDTSMQIKLSSTVHTSIYFSLKTKGLYGLDIKSSVNMTPFTLWDNTQFIDSDEIKNNFRYLALK